MKITELIDRLQLIAEDNDDKAMVVASLNKAIDSLEIVLASLDDGREMMSWEEAKVYNIAKDAEALVSGLYYDSTDDEISDDE